MLLTGDGTIIQTPREDQAARLLTVHRAPARCTQWNAVQDAFWLLWQWTEEAA